MADIRIVRAHALGFAAAREIARKWIAQAENEFGMACAYAEGDGADLVHFSRSGVKGSLQVSTDRFVLDAQLGFLLGAFKDKIEAEITNNLDALLAPDAVAQGAVRSGSAA